MKRHSLHPPQLLPTGGAQQTELARQEFPRARSASRWVAGWMLLVATSSAAAQSTIEAESVLLRLIDQIDVPATTAGVLTQVRVSEGVSVEAGQPLGRVDDLESDLKLKRAKLELQIAQLQVETDVSVAAAQTELRFAEQKYTRLKKAADSLPGSVSAAELADVELERVRATHKLADAERTQKLARATQTLKENDVATMQRKVDIQQMRAPLTGTIEHVYHREGEWVEPGTNVLRIISMRRLRAEGFVLTDAIQGPLAGAAVELTVKGKLRSHRVRGEVVFVHTEVDPVNNRVRVWAEIDNAQGVLRPGMRATMVIHQPKPKPSP